MPAKNIHSVLRDLTEVLTPLMKDDDVTAPLFRMAGGRSSFKLEVTWVYARVKPTTEPVAKTHGRRRRRRQRRQTTTTKGTEEAGSRGPEREVRPPPGLAAMEVTPTPDPVPPAGLTVPPPGFVAPAGEGVWTSSRLGRPAPPVSPHSGAAARPKVKTPPLNQPRTQAGPEKEEQKKKKPRIEEKEKEQSKKASTEETEEASYKRRRKEWEAIWKQNDNRSRYLRKHEKTGFIPKWDPKKGVDEAEWKKRFLLYIRETPEPLPSMPSPTPPLFVGLGNHDLPRTRHSVGMQAVDRMADCFCMTFKREKCCAGSVAHTTRDGIQIIMLKPKMPMNVNGTSVAKTDILQAEEEKSGAEEESGITNAENVAGEPFQHEMSVLGDNDIVEDFLNDNGVDSFGTRKKSKNSRCYNVSPQNIYLLHDDIDGHTGHLSMKEKGSANGHNGVKSVINSLCTDVMPRVKIGIDRPSSKSEVADYVLQNFSHTEQRIINRSIEHSLRKIAEHLERKIGSNDLGQVLQRETSPD